ncbi:hypothetical protein TWF225_001343 [Orbilia oligospora]|uniref:Uncharacterized protein n=1 Tax=Orbilia oligospora TaxID=2813651 RepID=A0A7C8KME7_ORBOL|nr:hypothetical protein TWF751_008880 [Orbilia oligospora]KAF3191182.1 hypothetical protein TWF225_001343 [Orbilia oligospora]KAF3238704.1 hypothetical protein TWF128_011959 [Orbilia oligospora]KAF3249665.1 hypothetical protein TWF217_008858 [Orbilia oligospora]KAF3279286.1 hypothetical protein TWF132_000653 [Orbilia oligospora]
MRNLARISTVSSVGQLGDILLSSRSERRHQNKKFAESRRMPKNVSEYRFCILQRMFLFSSGVSTSVSIKHRMPVCDIMVYGISDIEDNNTNRYNEERKPRGS